MNKTGFMIKIGFKYRYEKMDLAWNETHVEQHRKGFDCIDHWKNDFRSNV